MAHVDLKLVDSWGLKSETYSSRKKTNKIKGTWEENDKET